jgi:hypothetical protein
LQNAVTARGAACRIDQPSIDVAPNRKTSPADIIEILPRRSDLAPTAVK